MRVVASTEPGPTSISPFVAVATGCVALETVTVTEVVVVVLRTSSLITAARTCGPSAVTVVSQFTVYGAAVIGVPRSAPSSLNCTLRTLTLSFAVALTAVVPETVTPPAGAVSAPVGFVMSTSHVYVAGVGSMLPTASIASTENVWLPSLRPV